MENIKDRITEEEYRIIEAFEWDVRNALNPGIFSDGYNRYIAAVYLVTLARKYNLPSDVSLEDLMKDISDPDIKAYIKTNFSEDIWKSIINSAAKRNVFPLCEKIVANTSDENHQSTPGDVCRLASSLLDIGSKDKVADVCSGTGNFTLCEDVKNSKLPVQCFEINTTAKVIASMRSAVLGRNATFFLGDVFSIAEDEEKVQKESFDKVFSNYPFGMRIRQLGAGIKHLKELEEKIPQISKATSSDWVFNSLLVDLIKPEGKALAIMTMGSTFNTIDKPARKYFVEEGLIEAIIALPANLFGYTNIPTVMVILSCGNHSVKFIDAKKMCKTGRRYNTITEDYIKKIVQAYKEDGDFGENISIEKIRENDFLLSPDRYFSKVKEYSNGVKFEDIILNITRGASITAKKLDTLASDTPTEYQYLWLKNISEGVIDKDLPYISKIEKKYEKYCLKDNDLILSKNGYPYKVAVASVEEGHKILASGNMYVIELDREKVNPYYLKAFFESDQGINLLKSITVGATIPNIGVESLKKIMIPLPNMEIQNNVADKYQASLDEIALLKVKIERAKDKLSHVFDEDGEVI